MKYLFIAAVCIAAWFGWKKYQEGKAAEVPVVADPNRTPGADVTNRIDTRSGTIDPDAR